MRGSAGCTERWHGQDNETEVPLAMKRYTSKAALVALLAISALGSLVAVGLARPAVTSEQIEDQTVPSAKPIAKSQELPGLQELEGDWKMIQIEVDGHKQNLKDKGALWKWRGPLVQRTGPDGKCTWSAAHIIGTAGQLDLVFLDGDLTGDLNQQTVPCLFKFDRDKLIICLRNASPADDWIGYALLAVAVPCLLSVVLWPNRRTALAASLTAWRG
jgi:uncharacterized protein (TIGR03067 family)